MKEKLRIAIYSRKSKYSEKGESVGNQIELAKNYSTFYNKYKILKEDENIANARIYLTYMTNIVLKNGAKILGIEMPEKM